AGASLEDGFLPGKVLGRRALAGLVGIVTAGLQLLFPQSGTTDDSAPLQIDGVSGESNERTRPRCTGIYVGDRRHVETGNLIEEPILRGETGGFTHVDLEDKPGDFCLFRLDEEPFEITSAPPVSEDVPRQE